MIKLTVDMRLFFIFTISCLSFTGNNAQDVQWKPAGSMIQTAWAAEIDPLKPLPEYPRPQMVRDMWLNLNGLWDYSLVPQINIKPDKYSGKILVPFALESSLSGVGKKAGSDTALWYRTRFIVPKEMQGKRILLHFGAVDWQSEVFVNNTLVGSHKGGYDPFSFEITTHLKRSGNQTLEVKVSDPTNRGPQPRGKQVLKPAGIWYTAVTGIWQTVWLEAVPNTYITGTKQVSDIDKEILVIEVIADNLISGDTIVVTAWNGATLVSEAKSADGMGITLPVPGPKLWSPDNPFLYDLKVKIDRQGVIVDEIRSYFAMRKISIAPDANGTLRMMLNNSFVFQFGPLDQGWWPDGLYSAPTDEALRFDIIKTKQMGFNMIRKHVKVEPARWYYHCDRAGMLVWQDMPSGDLGGGKWGTRPGMEGGVDKVRTQPSEMIYRVEWNAIMDCLHNFPSIIVWVPFNEAWGQFKTAEITDWTMHKDPSRLVNSASGGNFHETGHILDLHNYPDPVMAKPEVFGQKQALVLGEFGGLGLPLEGHTWLNRDNWGYVTLTNADTLRKSYSNLLNRLHPFIKRGLSAAIYTQTTDVEVETNGLMTYDRKIVKMPESTLRELAGKLYETAALVEFKKK
jgi:beta-galactosidase/beta-glucuronidase